MTKFLRHALYQSYTVSFALGLTLFPSGCMHRQTPGPESVAVNGTAPETRSRKYEPPFRTYHHLGHSHFKRTTPATKESN
jgi:hypothetical protein